jgi:CRISPR-associated protein Cst2
MTKHIFGSIVTGLGIASNNRGLTEGNTTTLQKIVWRDSVHSTVSAEAIRFALRRLLADCNRTWNESLRKNEWLDAEFSRWAAAADAKPAVFADDDLLGFMRADAAKQENNEDDAEEPDETATEKKPKGTAKPKGTINVRRGVLEISRAISLTPWAGEVTFNAASPGASPAAAKKDKKDALNPVPYAAEMHATHYQYGFAMTPSKLRVQARAAEALHALASLGSVAGNNGRFLFDFSPETVIYRICDEASPRILNCYEFADGMPSAAELVRKVKSEDIKASEIIVGGKLAASLKLALPGIDAFEGVAKATEKAINKLELGLGLAK